MKKHLLLLFFISSIYLQQGLSQNRTGDALSLLQTTAKRLKNLKTVSYHYQREINNYANNYFSQTTDSCYLDFEKSTAANPFIFQFRAKDYMQIYNGTEYFTLDAADHTMAVTARPESHKFSSLSPYYNAIPTLRIMLDTLATDTTVLKSVSDTLIAGITHQVIHLSLRNKALDYAGGYRKFTLPLTIYYQLILDSKNGLPYQIIESNSADQEKYNTRVTFSALDTNPEKPGELSWYYSSYQQDYAMEKKIKAIPLIAAGQEIKDWILPVSGTGQRKTVKKEDFKGKVVVMDFWIKNCGPCMESFRHMKTLHEKYGKENLQLLSINSYEEKKEVEFFFQREKPAYLMLYQAEQLARQLGVGVYPSIVIIGKNGKVSYSQNGFDIKEIEQQLKMALAHTDSL